jgi:heterotetrameric sarcosine oxidase gamma subunit
MTVAQPDLTPVGAFAGMQAPKAKGVVIRELDGQGIAVVMARKGLTAALAARIRERFGVDLVPGARRVGAHDISFLGTGPGTWLAIRAGGSNAFATSLRDAIGEQASVVDQSDGLAVVRVSGARVRDALRKLFAIDLDARGFQPGDVAVTPAGHVGATLWRVDDLEASPAFEIAVHRTFAASFQDHLLEAAAGFDRD